MGNEKDSGMGHIDKKVRVKRKQLRDDDSIMSVTVLIEQFIL